MITFAYGRIQTGLSMPGLFEVSRRVPVGLAIEEIILIAECSLEGEWEGQVRLGACHISHEQLYLGGE